MARMEPSDRNLKWNQAKRQTQLDDPRLACTDYSIDHGCGCDARAECWCGAIQPKEAVDYIRNYLSYCDSAPEQYWRLTDCISEALARGGDE